MAKNALPILISLVFTWPFLSFAEEKPVETQKSNFRVEPNLSEAAMRACVLQDKNLNFLSSQTSCLSCFTQATFFKKEKLTPSSKWIFLAQIMAKSCDTQSAKGMMATSKLIGQFGSCEQSDFNFASQKEEDIRSIHKEFSPGISYQDDNLKRMKFRTIFGIDYPSAFFYFCKLQKLSPRKKLKSLLRRGDFVRQDFKSCAVKAYTQSEENVETCSIEEVALAKPISSDELNLEINRNLISGNPGFLASKSNQCYVASENKQLSEPSEKTFYLSDQPIFVLDTVANKKIKLQTQNCKNDGRCESYIGQKDNQVTRFFEIRCRKSDAKNSVKPKQTLPSQYPKTQLPTSYPSQ